MPSNNARISTSIVKSWPIGFEKELMLPHWSLIISPTPVWPRVFQRASTKGWYEFLVPLLFLSGHFCLLCGVLLTSMIPLLEILMKSCSLMALLASLMLVVSLLSVLLPALMRWLCLFKGTLLKILVLFPLMAHLLTSHPLCRSPEFPKSKGMHIIGGNTDRPKLKSMIAR